MIPTTDAINSVKMIAKAQGLDPALVCAIVEQESNWNPWAVRAEPAFDERYIKPLHQTPTEEWARSISWGLCQLMGESARELGYTSDLPKLCDPIIGVMYGCKWFKVKLDRAGGDVRKALLLWNGGSVPTYPDQVLARLPKYQ